MNKAGSAGTFRQIMTTTASGTKYNHQPMLNCDAMAASKEAVSTPAWESSMNRPIPAKTTKVMLMDGTVVFIMYRMWLKRSVPATAGARFVVSLNGLSLSPK